MRDLDEHYGTEDLYDLVEVVEVNARNAELARNFKPPA